MVKTLLCCFSAFGDKANLKASPIVFLKNSEHKEFKMIPPSTQKTIIEKYEKTGEKKKADLQKQTLEKTTSVTEQRIGRNKPQPVNHKNQNR